jgi:predicted transcriptional regulator YdeE
MTFKGIQIRFDCAGNQQYEAIGGFWDCMTGLYPGCALKGVGYNWSNDCLDYAIGGFGDETHYDETALRERFPNAKYMEIQLPDSGWQVFHCELDRLSDLYNEIYKDGALLYEIEEIQPNGHCVISIIRE